MPHSTPEFVVPLALYLVSEGCNTTHGVYSVGGGRYAKFFVGLAPGCVVRDGHPEVEDIAAHFGEIDSEAGYIVPGGAMDELQDLIKGLT